MGSVDAGEDDDRRVRGAYGFVDHGERLVVRDPKGELRHCVGGGWDDGVAVDFRMRAVFAGQAW
jgi:hypothetical protein